MECWVPMLCKQQKGFCQDDAAAVSALFWDVLTTSEPEAERRRSMALDQSCLPFASAVTRQGQERQQCVIHAYEPQDEQPEVCIVVPAKCLCTADRKITRQPSAVHPAPSCLRVLQVGYMRSNLHTADILCC